MRTALRLVPALLAVLLTSVVALAEDAPAPSPASIQKASVEMDTYVISGGKTQGWEVGDRARVTRKGQLLGTAVVVSVGPATASVLYVGRLALRAGDTVEFERRRKPLPKDPPPAANPGAGSPGGGAVPTGRVTTDWKDVGSVNGLNGTDWIMKQTRYCDVWARKQDLKYVNPIANGLDQSFEVNSQFTGITPKTPQIFYFFPLDSPAHTNPAFATRMARFTRFAGVAFADLNATAVNMGSWRKATHYEPWDIEQTCRHEMNHLFVYNVRSQDRMGTWGWLYEALAHTAENTIKPASTRFSLQAAKEYMKGYSAVDASFAAMIKERNNDDLEQFREYDQLLVSVIFFLQDKYGSDVIARLLKAARGKDIEDALVEVTGKGVKGIEAEWKAYYGVR